MTGQVINTNVSSLNAQRNLSTSQSALSQALQRLSSGLRINSAKDDAAGLAISERFTTQIRGLNQAVRNANDGISLAQTAEAALGEVTNNLQRIRELAVQSANATNSASDRAALDAEVQQRLAEIERIATQTSFNSQKVLDGTFGTATFQVGANVGETISLNLATSVRTTAIGKTADYVGGAAYATTAAIGQQGAGVDGTALSAGDITITVGSGQAVSVGAAVAGSSNGQTTSSAYAKAAAINASGISGVTATADTTAQFNLGTTAVAATETDYDLTINSVAIYTSYNGVTNGAVTSDQLVAAINANSATTGVTASYDSSSTRVTLTSSDGRNISVTQGSTTNATDGAAQGLGAAEGTNNTQNAIGDAGRCGGRHGDGRPGRQHPVELGGVRQHRQHSRAHRLLGHGLLARQFGVELDVGHDGGERQHHDRTRRCGPVVGQRPAQQLRRDPEPLRIDDRQPDGGQREPRSVPQPHP